MNNETLSHAASADDKYTQFIEKVAATKLVWGLTSKQGWANSSTNDNDDTTVVPFWSDRALAKASARDDWKSFTATEIPLAEFLEGWCVGMDENETLVGTNWDPKMQGHVTDPLQVAFDILRRVKAINSTIKFKNFDGVDEFLARINEAED